MIKATSDLRAAFPTFQAFTTGEARTILNTTRKVIVPLLEHFDKTGITVRTGNLRQMVATNSVSSQSHNY
jgi:selenocysteine-specific elongation factor